MAKRLLTRLALVIVPLILLLAVSPPASPAGGQKPTDLDYLPDRLLVRFKKAHRDEAAQVHARLGGVTIQAIAPLSVHVVGVPEGQVEKYLAAYSADPTVEYAEPDYLVQAAFVSNDPDLPLQWNLNKMQVPEAWDLSRGDGVIIAILDTGVDMAHPDLVDKLVPGRSFVDGADDDSPPADDHGHGTVVAGLAGAGTDNGIGIAGVGFNARVMPVKVLSHTGSGTHSTIASGLVWAVDNGARVINMSLGGPYASNTLELAVDYAWDHGALLTAAVGHEGTSTPMYPAAYEPVMGVAGTGPDDQRLAFSNYGEYISVAAPGLSVHSTGRGGGYGFWSGTSMAAPQVAGVAALVMSADPALTNTQVREILESSADDLGAPGWDPYYGHGRVNALRAVTQASPGLTPTPRPPTPSATPRPPTPGPTVSFTPTEPATPTATALLPPTATATSEPACRQIALIPMGDEVAWVVSGEEYARVGDDDLYTGIWGGRIYHGLFQIDISAVPEGATILWARIHLTGQTRAYLGEGGSWRLQFMAPDVDEWWPDGTYANIHTAKALFTVPPVLGNEDLGRGVINVFTFTPEQLPALEERLWARPKASFRLDGPMEGANNVFSWDSGHGDGGLNSPPVLLVCYLGGTPRPPTPTATPRPPTPGATPSATPRPPTATSTPRPPTPTPTGTPIPPPATSTPEGYPGPTATPMPPPITSTPGGYPGPTSMPILPH